MRLLLAEDEKELSRALTAILKHNNYTVDAVFDGKDALDYALSCDYDLMVFDIMMPKLNGLQLVEQIRQKNIATPILLLTAKSQIEDKIIGLDSGADDYLTKPFVMAELLARLRAMSRRQPEFVPDVMRFGNITIDKHNYELVNVEQRQKLTVKEFGVMQLLMENPNRLLSTEKMMERVWGYEAQAEINVVWVCISSLRKKLVSINADVTIKAFRGAGYKLEEII